MTYHSKRLEGFRFGDSIFAHCALDGELLKMDVQTLNIQKGTIEGYDTDMEMTRAKIIFRGVRVLKVGKEVPQDIYPGEEWNYIPDDIYEGKDAEALFLESFKGAFFAMSLSPCGPAWVLAGSGQKVGHVNIYFEFDQAEITTEGVLRPAWYERADDR